MELVAALSALSFPGNMVMGPLVAVGASAPGCGKTIGGHVACWVEFVLTGDPSGTRIGAAGLSGHSEQEITNAKC